MSTLRACTASPRSASSSSLARVSALLIALVLAGALAALSAPAASAHDLLLSSYPEDGETLESAPDELVLSFNNEPLEQGAAVEVTNADGEVVAEPEPTYAGVDVVFALPDLDPGVYDISWTVVSSDGHRISDDPALSFTVEGSLEEGPTPTEEPTEDAPEPATDTETTDETPGAGPAQGELLDDEESPGAWRVVGAAAAAAGVVAVVAALIVRIRRQQRGRDGR
ncbi:copper resistance CopC family protein [Bogoriella caseilytica]|nr:copper resistance CopC family protein [Bogoriella caseilytica]